MKSILIATDEKFWYGDRGGFARIANLYQYLTIRGFEMAFFFVGDLDDNDRQTIDGRYPGLNIYTLPSRKSKDRTGHRTADEYSSNIVNQHVGTGIFQRIYFLLAKNRGRPNKILSRIVKRLRSRFSGHQERKLQDFFSKEQQDYFRKVCTIIDPDHILIVFIRLVYLIDDLAAYVAPVPNTLLDTLDVMHTRCQSFHDFGYRHWINITKDEERLALEPIDVIIAIQQKDAAIFREMLPGKRVITVGYSCEVDFHEPRSTAHVVLGYIGSDGPHNQYAIEQLLYVIWPQILPHFGSKVQLNIVGRICTKLKGKQLPNGVKLLGKVDKLSSFYQSIDILVNPVSFGGGLKIKNAEALSFGTPLVTTKVGAEGLEDGVDHAFYVGDSTESMIPIIIKLIQNSDHRKALSYKAYTYAREKFNEDAVYKELYQVLMD